ncbi:MAG: L7Ae/L30e/S12e/Gadd45 family ribosomal protein [Gemmiger sp.]
MANDASPLLGALGICRKAGRLLHGYDRVEEAVLRGKAYLVLLACDASERTVQHMKETCEGIVPCRVMQLSTGDLRMLTPKPAAVFAVTDENFARLCAKHLTDASKEESANG